MLIILCLACPQVSPHSTVFMVTNRCYSQLWKGRSVFLQPQLLSEGASRLGQGHDLTLKLFCFGNPLIDSPPAFRNLIRHLKSILFTPALCHPTLLLGCSSDINEPELQSGSGAHDFRWKAESRVVYIGVMQLKTEEKFASFNRRAQEGVVQRNRSV